MRKKMERQTVWFLYTDTTLCLRSIKKKTYNLKINKMYFA